MCMFMLGCKNRRENRFEWKEMQKGWQGNARKDDQQNITKRESASHVCIYTCIMIALNLAFPKQMGRLDSKWLLKKRLVHDIIPRVRPPSATCSLKWKLQALNIFQLKTILNHTSEAFWLAGCFHWNTGPTALLIQTSMWHCLVCLW